MNALAIAAMCLAVLSTMPTPPGAASAAAQVAEERPASSTVVSPTVDALAKAYTTMCRERASDCPPLATETGIVQALQMARGHLVVSSQLSDQVRSRQEAIALAAIAIAWFEDQIRQPGPRNSGLGRQIAGLGVVAAGETLDPLHDPADQNRRSAALRHAEASPQPDLRGAFPDRALIIESGGGGCSEALVALLERVKAKANVSPSGRAAALFAAEVLSGLGAAAYPPDASCLG